MSTSLQAASAGAPEKRQLSKSSAFPSLSAAHHLDLHTPSPDKTYHREDPQYLCSCSSESFACSAIRRLGSACTVFCARHIGAAWSLNQLYGGRQRAEVCKSQRKKPGSPGLSSQRCHLEINTLPASSVSKLLCAYRLARTLIDPTGPVMMCSPRSLVACR